MDAAQAAQCLTDEMHEAVVRSPIGQYLDSLIRADIVRGGKPFDLAGGGNCVQQLWAAFMSAAPSPTKEN